MRRHLVRAAAAAALFTVTTAALAAEPTTAAQTEPLLGGPRDRWPTEIARRPLTLARGMFEIAAPLQLNASEGADWEPVTLNPSIAFGVTDSWTLGVRHFVGLCFGGTDAGCPEVYNDVSAFTRLSVLRTGGTEVALHAALDVAPLTDPEAFAAEAGLAVRLGGGMVALTLQPTVGFGLNDRDTRTSRTAPIAWNFGTYDIITPQETVGNKEHLSLPATLHLQLLPTLAVAAGASLEGPLDPEVGDFEDYYRIPVGFAAVLTPIHNLDVGASLTYPNMAGKDDTLDVRQLAVFVAFRI
jgi:hypothetical protein